MSKDATPLRLVWMDPAELPVNGQNWRVHPPAQTQALSAAIDQVGWSGALGKVWLMTSRLVLEGEIMVWFAEAEAKK